MPTHYNLSTTPASYDIVWCRFPYQEPEGYPKMRPGLVRRSFADQDGIRGSRSHMHVAEPLRQGLREFRRVPRLPFPTPVIGRLGDHMVKLLQIQMGYHRQSLE